MPWPWPSQLGSGSDGRHGEQVEGQTAARAGTAGCSHFPIDPLHEPRRPGIEGVERLAKAAAGPPSLRQWRRVLGRDALGLSIQEPTTDVRGERKDDIIRCSGTFEQPAQPSRVCALCNAGLAWGSLEKHADDERRGIQPCSITRSLQLFVKAILHRKRSLVGYD